MNESRVASRYAKSLLDLAKEKGVLDEVNEDMGLFVQVNEENPEFARVLKNPIISHSRKKGIMNALFKNKVNKLTHSLFDIIVSKNREGYLFYIAKEFQIQYRALKGIQSAVVRTTVPLTESQRENFIKMVKQISSRQSVQLKEIIDESIIGGFLLTIGDRQVDQTVRTKLAQLKNKFKDNPYIVKY